MFDSIVEWYKSVVEKIRQRLFSKTYWASAFLVVVGAIQPYMDLVTPVMNALQGKVSWLFASIGVVFALLREVTKKPLSEK